MQHKIVKDQHQYYSACLAIRIVKAFSPLLPFWLQIEEEGGAQIICNRTQHQAIFSDALPSTTFDFTSSNGDPQREKSEYVMCKMAE